MRACLFLFAVLLLWGEMSASSNCILVKPKSGDTLFIGDTVNFVYHCDSSFIEESGWTGIYFMIAPNTTPFFTLAPLERTNKSSWVPYEDSASGNIRIIIPDTLKKIVSGSIVSSYSASNSAVIRMETYGSGIIIDSDPTFVIKKRPISVVQTKVTSRHISGVRIKYDDGVLAVTPEIMAKMIIKVVDLNGRSVIEELKSSSIRLRLSNGIYLVVVSDSNGKLLGMKKIVSIK
jgi:hypothetical protein